MKNIYNLEDRLVRFAGECCLFSVSLQKNKPGLYYTDQLIRSAGSSALHYGEAQGAQTDRDYIYKLSNSLKELKESRVIIKILRYINYGFPSTRQELLDEVDQLIRILSSIILKKKGAGR